MKSTLERAPKRLSHKTSRLPPVVHCLGVCGRMVGGIAMALAEARVNVSGSDLYGFPPMPQLLKAAGVRLVGGWSAANVPGGRPVVVTGALLERGNVELEDSLARGLEVWNAAAFLEHYFLRGSQNMVVAGTKGKTSVTAMLAWILTRTGLAPDYVIGGQVRGRLQRVKLTGSRISVLEGDEYPCGLGDPLPKFLRYHPLQLVVTNVSHDHPDIYATPELYASAFLHLVNGVPGNGSITLNADDAGAMSLKGRTPTPVETVGFSRGASRRITRFSPLRAAATFQVDGRKFHLKLLGRMNALNAALAAVAACSVGVSLEKAAAALASFPGVEFRQDVLIDRRECIIYADEAYHPVAVTPLLKAMREHHRGRRVVCVFQPRYTGGRQGIGQRALPQSLAAADVVMVCPALVTSPVEGSFSSKRLCRDLTARGIEAHGFPTFEALLAGAPALCRKGDVIIISFCMGNERLAQQLAERIVSTVSQRP